MERFLLSLLLQFVQPQMQTAQSLVLAQQVADLHSACLLYTSTGASTAFIAPTIISCVQLGATVDYAILMTSRFQEELQSGKSRKEAIRIAAD